VERGSWPADRATSRGGDVSLRSWRRPLSWSGAPGPLAAQLRAEWTPRCAREGGPEDRPTYSALRTVTPRFARGGGPEDRPTLPHVQWPTNSVVSLRSRRRPGGPPHVTPRTVTYVQCRLASLEKAARRTAPRYPTYSAPRTVPYVRFSSYKCFFQTLSYS
jgi:hypothetical protein